MKYFFLVMIAVMSIPATAQELSKREIKRISRLGIDISNQDLYDEQLTKEFREILRVDRKRRSNRTSGIILSSLSAISIGFGAAIFANPVESEGHANAFRGLVAGIAIVTGAIEGGIGVPLLFVSNKRKRERDRLIRELEIRAE